MQMSRASVQSHIRTDDINDETPMTRYDEWLASAEPILRHINVHRFLWGFTVVCAFLAWNRGLLLLYGLVAFLLAVLAICHWYRWINLRGLFVTSRFIDDHLFENDTAKMSVCLSSRSTKHFLRIDLPLVRINRHNIHSPNSQDKVDERDTASLTTQLFVLYSHGKKVFGHSLTLRRGVYQLSHSYVNCGYPLGILHSDAHYEFAISTLHVLPTQFHIAALPVFSALRQGQDKAASAQRGGHDEFVDLRPYRRGDAFKIVHWGASAKQVSRGQDWMVKEFTNRDTPRVIIVLNQFQLRQADAVDRMISIALSIGDCFVRQGYRVSLLGYDVFCHSITDFWQMDLTQSLHLDKLRKLAEIDPVDSAQLNYDAAMLTILNHFSSVNVVVSFSAQQSHEGRWQGLLNNSTHYRVVLYDNAENNHLQPSPFCHEYHIHPATNLDALATLFAHNGKQA